MKTNHHVIIFISLFLYMTAHDPPPSQYNASGTNPTDEVESRVAVDGVETTEAAPALETKLRPPRVMEDLRGDMEWTSVGAAASLACSACACVCACVCASADPCCPGGGGIISVLLDLRFNANMVVVDARLTGTPVRMASTERGLSCVSELEEEPDPKANENLRVEDSDTSCLSVLARDGREVEELTTTTSGTAGDELGDELPFFTRGLELPDPDPRTSIDSEDMDNRLAACIILFSS